MDRGTSIFEDGPRGEQRLGVTCSFHLFFCLVCVAISDDFFIVFFFARSFFFTERWDNVAVTFKRFPPTVLAQAAAHARVG